MPGIAFLATPTRQGDPSLAHGYAITCHVAQGVTVDRTFVLAGDSLTRKLGYTAMSRGRHRSERAAVLAIDSGRPDPEQKLPQAKRHLTDASATRARLEAGRWRPGRRRELQIAVKREVAARRTVDDLARVVAEQRHASRPGLDEGIERQRRAEQRDRIIEREMKRSVSRGLKR